MRGTRTELILGKSRLAHSRAVFRDVGTRCDELGELRRHLEGR